ncbi:hypothetical protein RHMOL_Rhmol04G0217000 [Rhododendron molle]|uniref:Uncharacterized protein n=1 Tax=Rhododendron molle TaxID=49168 RepID=A0ACC0P2T3_RHOML|nr:hypothetical protein RHMOL_Rhmol04G0217000 [Rhododendron molle]
METTRPPLQNSIHRTPQPSPSPSHSQTTSRKRGKTRPDSDQASTFDSNADSLDSLPQWSHSHRCRDSEGCDDGKRRKRSPLKKISDDGVAKCRAKKAPCQESSEEGTLSKYRFQRRLRTRTMTFISVLDRFLTSDNSLPKEGQSVDDRSLKQRHMSSLLCCCKASYNMSLPSGSPAIASLSLDSFSLSANSYGREVTSMISLLFHLPQWQFEGGCFGFKLWSI